MHVTYENVAAYATWIGKEIPTEAECEFAAWGGRENAEFAWGDELHPNSKMMANTWQGEFPWQNLKTDGYEGTSPATMDSATVFNAHRQTLIVGLNLLPFAGIAFLWFMEVVRDRMGSNEDQFFATVFLGSGLLFLGYGLA